MRNHQEGSSFEEYNFICRTYCTEVCELCLKQLHIRYQRVHYFRPGLVQCLIPYRRGKTVQLETIAAYRLNIDQANRSRGHIIIVHSYCSDWLFTSFERSSNSRLRSSSGTRSILWISMKMLASGEHRSMESIMRANTDRSLWRSAESMSYRKR